MLEAVRARICHKTFMTLGFTVFGIILGTSTLSQIKSGTITGSISDNNGAAVPGASVSIINQETNVATTTVADDSGTFTVPYLQPGVYTVNVEAASGFAKHSQKDVQVSTNQTVTVDVQLKPGNIAETVTVSADAAVLQANNATVQSVVNERIVQTLPNITHNPFAYATLQAGVVPRGLFGNTQSTTSFGVGIDGRRQASAVGINGGSAFSNDIVLDGVSIQGSAWNETAVLPNMDSLQEVRIISNNFTAEYGRAQGVVVFTTKSGSNDFHGSAFFRLRNEALNANGFTNNSNKIPRGAFRSRTFGGTVGGPIIRDKAFFFFSYEGLRFNRAYDYLLTVPTAAERRGDFSNTFVGTLTNPLRINIYDPFNASRVGTTSTFERALLPSVLPASRINAHGLAILNAYPLPNRTPRDIFNTENFFFRDTQTIEKNNINTRVDYQWRNHSFYGTYGFQKGNIRTPRSWGNDNPYYSRKEFVGNQQPDDNPYVAFGDTIVLSSTLILDLRVGVNRIKSDNEADVIENYDYNVFGIPAPIQAINILPGAPPAVPNAGNFGNVSPLNNGTSLHKRERQTNTDFNGSMTWTRGRWTHKFGGNYRVLLSNYIDPDDSMQIRTSADFTRRFITADGGASSVPGITTDARDTGQGMASILLGAGIVGVTPGFAIRLALAQKYMALYSQNDWRVNDKLTLNLGLRWDLQPGPTERFNRISSIDLDAREPIFGTLGAIVFPGVTTKDRNIWKTRYKDFGPRIGGAYQWDENTVVRAGFGLTYVPSNTGFNDGPGFYGAGAFTAAAIGAPYGPNPAGVVVGTFDTMTVNTVLQPVGANPNDTRNYGLPRRFQYDYENGHVQQWNVFIERKFGPNWTASAGYIGSRGDKLQVVFLPINNAQVVDPALLESWRNTYIASNGTVNPSTQPIQSPFQPATGPLRQFGDPSLNSRTLSRLAAAFPHPLQAGGNVTTLSVGESNYQAMQLTLTRHFARGFQMNAHYTWSKQLATSRYNAQTNQGYADGGEIAFFPNRRPDLWRVNRKLTTNDIPHRFVASWVYDLPVGRGHMFGNTDSKVANALIGGWRLGGSFSKQSGFVFPLQGGGTQSINGLPDRVDGVPIELPKELQRWYDGQTRVTLPSGRVITPCSGCFLKYNIDAFAGRTVVGPNGVPIADLFWYGTAAATYDEMRSNPTWNTNMSLEKDFRLGERYSIVLSAQVSNVFNNVQFRPGLNANFGATVLPATITANPTQNLKVGQLLDTANTFGTFRQNAYDGRQVELVAKFRF